MSQPFREALARARAVLFDFDNVLADSEPFHYEAYRRVFARLGHPVDAAEYWIHWTSRGEGAEGEARRHGLAVDGEAVRREKGPIYSAFCAAGEIPFYPQAREIAERLRGAGKLLAVASGTPTADLHAVLAHGRMEGAFDAVLGRDLVARGKPAPDIFVEAARRLGVERCDCVVIEDAEKGVAAAMAAGIPVAVVLTRYTLGIPFDGADWVLPDHPALLAEVRAACGAGDSPDRTP